MIPPVDENPPRKPRRPVPTRPPAPAEEAETTPVAASDPQEYDFMGVREGRQWAVHEADRAAQDTRELILDAEGDAGSRAWRIGDKLTEQYMGFAERAKGFPSFEAYATAAFDLTEDQVRDYLLVRARVSKVDAARSLGRTRITLGFRLFERLGVSTFETLSQRELLLEDGTTCRFPATVGRLRSALRVLARPKPASLVSRKVAAETARLNERWAAARREEPALQGVKARFVAEGSEILFGVGRMSRKQRLAVARFILETDGDA